MEQLVKDVESVESEETKSKRSGFTVVTSVSVSKEFKELMERYAIAPTEALRKGVAVELYERGIPQYQSPTNSARYEAIKGVLAQEKLANFDKTITKTETLLKEIKQALRSVTE